MGDTPKINPCLYKRECKECRIADANDRPFLCVAIKCEHYTPCAKCGDNKTLDAQKTCTTCVKKSKPIVTRAPDGQLIEIDAKQVRSLSQAEAGLEQSDVPTRDIAITVPGTPPHSYSQEEKEYYVTLWKEYSTYYRDPTTKTILHNIIILEVELNWVIGFINQKRGSTPIKDFEEQRNRIIRNLSELRGQLPEKEANQESDDERFLSMIYEKYAAVHAERRVGKVARLLTPEAVALAPALHFPMNPQALLTNLGYRQLDAIQAMDHITVEDLPDDPKKTLEFFGFFLDEKYALPIDEAIEPERAIEDLDALADPIIVKPVVEGAVPLTTIPPQLSQVREESEYSGADNEYA